MSGLISGALAASTDTRAVLLGPGVVSEVAAAFRRTFPDRAAVLVGDERTMAAAGWAVQKALADAGVVVLEPFVFPGVPELYAL